MATEDNSVYIGSKPIMSYVLAVITQFNNGSKEVLVKARGRSISKAVDVAEIVRRRFLTEAKVKGIGIGTEEVKTDEGTNIKVSSIEIALTK